MNVFTFISIVRQCLHEETSLTDFTCQIDQKKNKTTGILSTELKQLVCEPLWYPVNPKTCIILCHFGAYGIIRKQSTKTHHQGTNDTCAFR